MRSLIIFSLTLVAILLASCGRDDSSTGELTLYVISPHGTDIRKEFEQGFSEWHKAKYGKTVKIQWPDIGGGGTGNIVKFLHSRYSAGPTADADIVFGGGSAAFNDFMKNNFLEVAPLPKEVADRVPNDIFGTPLKGKDNLWFAATLSNFGIVVNKDRLNELKLPMPTHWDDIAAPQWFGHLSLADPSKSRSVLSSYDMIFQQYGWEKAWPIVVQIFANAESIKENGSAPSDDVGSAAAVAGIVIDFYGRVHIKRVGPHIVGFVVPEGGSTIDPDPIAMLRGAPHKELAGRFIEYVISPEGQRLWTFKNGVLGGPKRTPLGRLNVLPELYEKESSQMFDPINPFAMKEALKADPVLQRVRATFLGDLVKSTIVDNHAQLVAVRKAIRDAGDKPELLAKLGELPRFTPSDVVDGKLQVKEPQTITTETLKAVGDEYRPPAKPKSDFVQHRQAELKRLWRDDMKRRLDELQAQLKK